MLADKYHDIILEALRTYEKTRQEKDGLDVIGRATRAGLIEPGHYDEATLILREQIKNLPDNENFPAGRTLGCLDSESTNRRHHRGH